MFGSYVTHDSDYLARTVGRPAPTVGTKLRIGGFRDATGELLISKSKVSEITDPLWQDYQAFITRALSFGLRARAGSINTP